MKMLKAFILFFYDTSINDKYLDFAYLQFKC